VRSRNAFRKTNDPKYAQNPTPTPKSYGEQAFTGSASLSRMPISKAVVIVSKKIGVAKSLNILVRIRNN
jgi:hypothetical protein